MALPIFQRNVVDNQGNVQPSASVTVFVEATGQPAIIYSDRAGLVVIDQPLITGLLGAIEFYADSNEYRIEAVGGTGSATWRYFVMGNSTIEAEAAADASAASAAAALVSENNASTSAGNASTSETNAGNSETAAGNSETAAGNSETAAGNSETAAGNSETSAANDAAAADATLKDFETKYLGAFAVAPTLDNEGNALVVGAAYWLTTEDKIYIWNGTAWALAIAGGTAATYDVGAAAGQIPTNALLVPPVVADFVGANHRYVANNTFYANIFDMVGGMVSSTRESIGPTGSGALRWWSALNGIPVEATYITLRLIIKINQTSDTNPAAAYVIVYSGLSNEQTRLDLKYHPIATSDDGNATLVFDVPVDGANVFDALWADVSGNLFGLEIELYVAGFGV